MRPAAWTRYILLGVVALALVGYYFRFSLHPAGMAVYSQAADCMVKELPINTCSPLFTYPPFFALLMIPFTILPVPAQNALWYVILLGLTYGSYRICETLVLETVKKPFSKKTLIAFRVLSVILSFNFVLAVFENQAFDILILFLVSVGLLGLARNKLSWTALGLGMAAALKATPALFFPYLALKRKWKEFALCIGSYLGLSLLPDLFFTITGGQGTYYGNWIRQVALQPFMKGISRGGMPSLWEGENALNQSLRPLVLHVMAALNIHENFSLALYGTYALCFLYGLWVFARSSGLTYAHTLDGSLILTGMLLFSPMSSKSHFVALILPFMLVTAQILSSPNRRSGLILAVISIFMLNNFTSKDLVGSKLSDLAGRWSSVALGTIILALAIGSIANSERQVRDEKGCP